MVLEHRHECLVDERGLTAAADSGHSDQHSEREIHIYVLEVVSSGTTYAEGKSVSGTALCRDRYTPFTTEVLQGCRRAFRYLIQGAAVTYFSTCLTGTRAYVYKPVSCHHGLCIMLDHHH
jgi:hypothetical protein